MKRTRAVFFPFDLFGSGGAGAGAQLLADGVEEMLADNRREKVPTRARAYTDKLRVEEVAFDTLASYKDWRGRGRQAAAAAWAKKDFVLWVTGNHLGTLPIYDELGEDCAVIQFDAHLDIYNLSDCTEELSHGNFLLHAQKPLPVLFNVGHRELLLEPAYVDDFYRATWSAAQVACDVDQAVAALRTASQAATRIFVDLDCDVFDPAYFPATSHAQPFGLSPQVFLRLLEAAWSERVVGFAISEFDPGRDVNDRCLATLLWLIEYVLLKVHEKR